MISVIICTYNRDKFIYNVLRSIAENDLPHSEYEIVLINNNSNDKTEEECRRFQADYGDIRFVYYVERNQGLSYARNAGIQRASGDILVYVDDDATVNKEYLRTYADFLSRHADAMAAGGPIIPVYETEEPAWFSPFTKALITGYSYSGSREKKYPRGKYPGGGNCAYRRAVFDRIGLFNVELGRKGSGLVGAEEKDIFDKMTSLGMQFYYLPQAILYHIITPYKLTDEYFNRLTYSIGMSERIRTRQVSPLKYAKRIFSELVKWAASIVLWCRYAVVFQFEKGNRIIRFRWNVTRGLLGMKQGE